MKMRLDEKTQLVIDLEPKEKLELFSEVSRINKEKIEPFSKWINSPDVPQEEKVKYSSHKINILHAEGFIIQFMLRCGFTEQEVCECFNLPF